MVLVIGTIAVIGFVALLVAYATVFAKFAEDVPAAPTTALPPVSVLKPLKGDDDGLYENLSAIVRQDYPNFEVLFCAEDPDDPALAVARRVAEENPTADVRVLSGAAADGLNPKVRILRRLIRSVRHDWVLVSDSNVRPGSSYLRQLFAYQVKRKADLVTTLLAGVIGDSLGARLENLQLNSWVAASLTTTEAGGHPCVIGKTMLMHRPALEAVGGFEAMKDILAEDYTLGARMTAAGYTVACSPYSMPVISGARDIRTFFNRHTRWGQLRRRIAPLTFLFELTVQPTPWFLFVALLGGPVWKLVALGALAVKFGIEVVLHRKLTGRVPSWRSLALMPLKDLLVFAMWFSSALRTTYEWRGHRMRIGPESRAYPLDGDAALTERVA